MIKSLVLFFILTFSSLGLSNENLSKLNNLYLNGVLDKEMYFNSLNKLGINIDNKIFQNLFDLFSNQTLDLQSYEKSISNLINLSNKDNSKKEDSIDNNKNNSFNGILFKKFKDTRCVGDGEICRDFKGEILFSYDNSKVYWDDEFINELLSDPEFLMVIQEKFSLFDGNKFHSIFIMRLSNGLLANFIAEGNFNKDPFDIEKIYIRVNGKDIATLFVTEV